MRIALNLLITTGLLFLFNAFGWLTISHDGSKVEFGNMTFPMFGSVLLLAVIIWLVGIVVGILYAFSVVFTLGLMILAFPFIGWAVLEVTEHFLPDRLELHNFWLTAVCGFLLMILNVSKREEKSE